MFSFKLTLFAFAAFCAVQNVVSRNIFESPPPHGDKAKMARYVVHNSDWTSIGTISTQTGIKGFPFVGVKSVADGPRNGNGNGIPYMMMTEMDVSMIDLKADNKCTLFFTLAQGDYCKDNEYDPQDPRCARIMLTGSVHKVDVDSDEFLYAKNALISRHPAMNNWPTNHGFFVAKIDIIQVAVLDYFGGIEYVTPEDYLKNDISERSWKYFDNRLDTIEVQLIN